MEITSLDIRNSLSTNHAKIINILDFDPKKLSIIKTKKNKIHIYYDHYDHNVHRNIKKN